jgi:antitoxin component of MazEF toxin-antitoxin module
MVQKVIKIGSSAGVTIPKKQLDELGIAIGDEVKLTIEPVDSDSKQEKLMYEYQKFVKQYGQTLKNLAGR